MPCIQILQRVKNMKELMAIVRREKSMEVKRFLESLNLPYGSKKVLGKGREGGISYQTSTEKT